jgi:glycosyltransferase involved in cell wall biosynthesis
MTPARRVVCDLRAIQSPDHRGRGIGRWAYELATALERVRPDLIGAYLLDPEWPPPGAADELLASEKLTYLGTAQADEAMGMARVHLCASPFELGKPISAMRPKFVDELGLFYAAIAYDLIPLHHPEEYLVHPGQRRRYGARLNVLSTADAILAISEHAADDIRLRLGVEPSRCHTVGTGVSRHFVPPASRPNALQALRHAMPDLRDRYVLYPGGNDGRKNIEGLIRAYAELPSALLGRFQLVVVGDLPPLTANHYRHLARLAGIEDRLLLTGFVSDDRLTQLYQATDLFVFPSIAEGYGLPVAEALACGAVACVSDRPPLDALVRERRARFDPFDGKDMASAIERCLTDAEIRAAVVAAAPAVVTSWDEVARRTADVLEGLALRRHGPRPWRRRGRVAVVSPFPPSPSGIAGYSKQLVEAMRRQVATRSGTATGAPIEIDCFADGLEHTPGSPEPVDGRLPRDARAFGVFDGATGTYDHVVYVLGNSEFHAQALASLRRRPGVVVAHDVRLSGLMTLSAAVPGAVPGGVRAAIARNYPLLPPELGSSNQISAADRDRYGLLLLRDVVEHTPRLLVSSEAARRLAELDTGPQSADRLGVLPFAMARLSPEERERVRAARDDTGPLVERERPPLIASFGIVDPSKRPGLVIEALAELRRAGIEARLALVGSISEALTADLTDLARGLGVGEAFQLTGPVSWSTYLDWLGRTDIAVQLRSHSSGEASGAVSECLSAGLATVVSDLGWMHDLPDDAVVKVPYECSAAALAAALSRLLGDDADRRRLADEGERHASRHTFDGTAAALLAELGI